MVRSGYVAIFSMPHHVKDPSNYSCYEWCVLGRRAGFYKGATMNLLPGGIDVTFTVPTFAWRTNRYFIKAKCEVGDFVTLYDVTDEKLFVFNK